MTLAKYGQFQALAETLGETLLTYFLGDDEDADTIAVLASEAH